MQLTWDQLVNDHDADVAIHRLPYCPDGTVPALARLPTYAALCMDVSAMADMTHDVCPICCDEGRYLVVYNRGPSDPPGNQWVDCSCGNAKVAPTGAEISQWTSDDYQVACEQRIVALEAALRDALHQLATRNGWWVTDKPRIDETIMVNSNIAKPAPAKLHGLYAIPGTYHRDDTTEACKRIKAALSDS